VSDDFPYTNRQRRWWFATLAEEDAIVADNAWERKRAAAEMSKRADLHADDVTAKHIEKHGIQVFLNGVNSDVKDGQFRPVPGAPKHMTIVKDSLPAFVRVRFDVVDAGPGTVERQIATFEKRIRSIAKASGQWAVNVRGVQRVHNSNVQYEALLTK
jgi:hypothetical protein